MEHEGCMVVDAVAILKAGRPWKSIPMHKCSGPIRHVPKVVDYTLEHGATCIIHGLLLPMHHLATTNLTMGTRVPHAQTIPGSRLYIGLLVHNDVNIVFEVQLTHLVKPNITYSFQ